MYEETFSRIYDKAHAHGVDHGYDGAIDVVWDLVDEASKAGDHEQAQRLYGVMKAIRAKQHEARAASK